jgi:hypothetical protein
MIGAIAGDIIGSVYEQHPIKNKDFPLLHPRCVFTDDTLLSVAIAEAILTRTPYVDTVRQVDSRYPPAGYGKVFTRWLRTPNAGPCNSWATARPAEPLPGNFSLTTGHGARTPRAGGTTPDAGASKAAFPRWSVGTITNKDHSPTFSLALVGGLRL